MVNELNRKLQKQLEDNISRIDKRMAALAKEQYEEVMEALLTIPGIGQKTAIELVTVTDGFRRFDSPRTVTVLTYKRHVGVPSHDDQTTYLLTSKPSYTRSRPWSYLVVHLETLDLLQTYPRYQRFYSSLDAGKGGNKFLKNKIGRANPGGTSI